MARKLLLTFAALLIGFGSAQAVEGAAGLAIVRGKPGPEPKPAPSCSTGVDRKSCKDIAGCVWCEATFGPAKKPKGSCYDEASAAWLPAVFKCSKPATNEPADPTTATADSTATNPATSQPGRLPNAAAAAALLAVAGPEPPSPVCADEVDKASCNDKAGCVWCEKGIMGMCFSQERAQWLPPQIFKCPRTYTATGANSPAAAPDFKLSCKDAVDKAFCKGTTGCVWCEGSFGPGKPPKAACYSEVKAQFLPAQFFKCTAPSAAVAAAAVAKDADASAAAPGAKSSCKGAVDKASCKGTTGCVWCEGSFGPGKPPKAACYSQVKAQFLPAQFFKCTAPSAALAAAAAAAAAANDDGELLAAPSMASCKGAVNEDSCTHIIGCVWCEATFGPAKKSKAACYSQTKAQFLPAQFFKCAAPTGAVATALVNSTDAAAGGSAKLSCKGAVDEVSCKDVTGCVWCEANFSPAKPSKGRCYSEDKAQWLPSVFKCGAPSAVAAS